MHSKKGREETCYNWYACDPTVGFPGKADTHIVQNINITNETIELAGSSDTDADGLASAISNTEPRYSVFRYSHQVEGSEQTPTVFIYTCPSGSKIKERMVYASTKQSFLAAMSSEIGLPIAKKVSKDGATPLSTWGVIITESAKNLV